jgi:hypothetical protein
VIDDFADSREAELMQQYAYSMPVLIVAGILDLRLGEIEAVARDLVTEVDSVQSTEACGRVAAHQDRRRADRVPGRGERRSVRATHRFHRQHRELHAPVVRPWHPWMPHPASPASSAG